MLASSFIFRQFFKAVANSDYQSRYIRPSVRAHGGTPLIPNIFSWNSVLGIFTKIYGHVDLGENRTYITLHVKIPYHCDDWSYVVFSVGYELWKVKLIHCKFGCSWGKCKIQDFSSFTRHRLWSIYKCVAVMRRKFALWCVGSGKLH
jgi:hypothetical protein